MIAALTVLLGCQLAGEITARLLGIPVPGPVLGLLLLLGGILLYARHTRMSDDVVEQAPLSRTANGLLQNLSLLFVPAGAGVIQHLGLLGEHLAALIVALVASAALTLIVTVFAFRAVQRWQARCSGGSA
jgi:putative effector of murein hydrolase LrgA (UPF0299 family)